jgi:hypothetical protein
MWLSGTLTSAASVDGVLGDVRSRPLPFPNKCPNPTSLLKNRSVSMPICAVDAVYVLQPARMKPL